MNLREALYQYERTQVFFDDTADNHAVYAELLYRAARISDAILAARHAVTLAPERYETWNFIAAMQSQIGTIDQARATYEKSLEVNPDQPQVRAILEQVQPK